MILKIKTINNILHEVEVNSLDFVAELKHKISLETGIVAERQRLIYRGRVLTDGDTIASYGLEDGNIVHMVARPIQHQPSIDRGSLSIPSSSSDVNETSSVQNTTQTNMESINIEHIRQGLLTTNTLLSTMNNQRTEDGIFSQLHVGEIKFYVGQWIDVKDTVSQWLEATIMDIDEVNRRLFIHYNGW